jgi:hypothetical protein
MVESLPGVQLWSAETTVQNVNRWSTMEMISITERGRI